MSKRFEEAIQLWYDKSKTADLEYLSLETQPTLKHLSHNLDVVYDRLLLLSKVSIKDYYKLLESLKSQHQEVLKELEKVQKSQSKILAGITTIQGELVAHQPLTTKAVKDLVVEIAQQPKLVEEEALRLTEDLRGQIKEVKQLVHEVRQLIIS